MEIEKVATTENAAGFTLKCSDFHISYSVHSMIQITSSPDNMIRNYFRSFSLTGKKLLREIQLNFHEKSKRMGTKTTSFTSDLANQFTFATDLITKLFLITIDPLPHSQDIVSWPTAAFSVVQQGKG
ncbi:CLUMA_CG008604, isoform A [Clunio marinus]|uniref:CLUMA_CG008604, isoform A n=1 Tax=Clunio marinus TaxID=568069 RepID=A0A1J1I853_9DIPT|nr:CLUMA_CG008604, isoform A [Clunio marinus]